VGPTEDPAVSRMTIAVHVGRQQAEQATKQLAKLVDVITIDDVTGQRVVAHELLLLRMHAPNASRRDLLDILEIFRGRVVDIASESVIVEVTGSTEKVDNFIDLMRPFGIKEMARSGAVALVRGDDARLRLVDFETPHDLPEPSHPVVVDDAEAVDMTGNV
jgi:acetolactate synthase I/III small subunit